MSTMTTDATREQMLAYLESAQGYRFLTMAAPHLQQCRDDHYVRLMAIREYVKLGLAEPASELLDTGDPPVELPPEFASLRPSLDRLAPSRLPWSDRSDQYARNLSVLVARDVDVSSIEEAWNARGRCFELFRDANGVHQVRMRNGDGVRQWIPFLGDHAAVDNARAMPDGLDVDLPAPVLFEGIDLGHFFERVYRATKDTFLGYSCALFVVEPDPALLALVFHLRDWSDLLADERVYLFAGDSCVDRLVAAWETDPDLLWPRQALHLSLFRPACSPPAVDVVSEAGTRREHHIGDSLRQLDAQYASRDRRYWAKRFGEALSGEGEPLRILAAVSTHTTFLQYAMRDARRALEAMGHRCIVLTEKSPHHAIGPLTYHDRVRRFDPDLFFALDHVRPEFSQIVPANLPILTWDQDQLPQVFSKHNVERIAPHDFILGCSKSLFLEAGGDARQFLHARVPTCAEAFGGDALTDAEWAKYGCDVSFVSHASQTPLAFHEHERGQYRDPKLQRLLDVMYEMVPPMLAVHRVPEWPAPVMLLEDAARRCGASISDTRLRDHLLWWYLWRLGDRIFRHEALEWVARWAKDRGREFRIYGNGWDAHPTLAEFAAGPAENGRELLCVHRASKINLQLMPAGFIHQRALDGLVSGGFFLTRLVPHDFRGKTLRQLDARIRELGITTQRQLLDGADHRLRGLLADYFGSRLDGFSTDGEEVLRGIQVNAELTLPDEVFPEFREIAFDSGDEFAHKADRFLADEAHRTRIAEGMRSVAIERFSYRATMEACLQAMAKYLMDKAR